MPRARPGHEPAARRRDFLALGAGAHTWLIEASAVGATRIRAKMAAAVELTALIGDGPVDAALGVAAAAGRFGEGDLATICDHQATGTTAAGLVAADETHSAQPGAAAWAAFGATTATSTTPTTEETAR